jgi:hypothetical protein
MNEPRGRTPELYGRDLSTYSSTSQPAKRDVDVPVANIECSLGTGCQDFQRAGSPYSVSEVSDNKFFVNEVPKTRLQQTKNQFTNFPFI